MGIQILKDAPDFSFAIVENNKEYPSIHRYIYNSGDKKLKSVGTISTILDMHELMAKSLEIIAPLYPCGLAPSPDPSSFSSGIYFCPDYPEFLLPKDDPGYRSSPQVIPNVITWGCVRKEPGTVSGPIFRGTQEIHPRVREFIAVFQEDTKKYIVAEDKTDLVGYDGLASWIDVKGQVFDNLIQYNIWSKSNYEVERLTEWFEAEYMDNYIGMFREAGVINIVFNRRVRDDTLVHMKNGYHVRSVLYYVRTERISLNTIVPIKRINLNVRVKDLQALAKESLDHSIESDLDKIMRKWVNRNQFGGING
jgi:hypothetical protein